MEAPSISELSARLAAELERLGIDPDKTTSAAPSGSENAVFDLAAAIVDAEGNALTAQQIADGAVVAGIALAWTEQLAGDYDQNGEVNASDLTPISIYWHEVVEYDAPVLHGGFDLWPAGDPADDGAAGGPPAPPTDTPPQPDSGAANWRRARIDADGNGLIAIYEISPIALHWKQTLSGYRVYRRAPGETQYQLIIDPADATSMLTCPRSALNEPGKNSPDPLRPVRYDFTDAQATPGGLGNGTYQYYVAAYDAGSATEPLSEGPPSAAISVNIQSGVANRVPLANLSLSDDFSGTPAVLTLDASASYDMDGTIAELRWDLDGDGIVDYSTADAAPAASSSTGLAVEITPGATAPGDGPPRTLSATYKEGRPEYLYPSVTVVDDGGASGLASTKLGLIGWELEQISGFPDYLNPPGQEVGFAVGDLACNPLSGEIAAAGVYHGGFDDALQSYALYYAVEHDTGSWEQELVCSRDSPELKNWDAKPDSAHIAWSSDGAPVLIINASAHGSDQRVFLAEKQSGGDWELRTAYAGQLPLTSGRRGATAGTITPYGLGKFALLFGDLTDKTDPEWGFTISQDGILWYDNGSVTTELIDTPQLADSHMGAAALGLDPAGTQYLLLGTGWTSDPYSGLRWLIRDATQVWVEQRIDVNSEELFPAGSHPVPRWLDFSDGVNWCLSIECSDTAQTLGVLRNQNGVLRFSPLRGHTHGPDAMCVTPSGVVMFSDYAHEYDVPFEGLYGDLVLPDGEAVPCNIVSLEFTEGYQSGAIWAATSTSTGGVVCALYYGGYWDDPGNPGETIAAGVQYLAYLIDPR